MMTQRRQRGFLSMVVMALVVVIITLAIVLGYLFASSTLSSGSHLGSMQALFLAEGGLEFEQRRWSRNLDWYRSATDPNPIAAGVQPLGSGTFAVSSNLPATLMRTGASAATGTLNVYTTDRFPTTGILQVEDDLTASAEFVRYTGVTATTFTGVTRGQTVGTVATVASPHSRSNRVYPVTLLRTALAANCAALATMLIDANSKFLSAGTINIEGEEIGYASSSTSGVTTTLTGITRCLDLVTATALGAAHAIGQPVTPVLVGGDSADYQIEAVSRGTQGNNIRYARRTIQR